MTIELFIDIFPTRTKNLNTQNQSGSVRRENNWYTWRVPLVVITAIYLKFCFCSLIAMHILTVRLSRDSDVQLILYSRTPKQMFGLTKINYAIK